LTVRIGREVQEIENAAPRPFRLTMAKEDQ
jgi:hypothetical protein